MTTLDAAHGDTLQPLQLAQCPYCGNDSPVAAYCGACGAHISHAEGSADEGHHPRRGRRHHSFAAFPGEPVLRLSAVTSLFPHLAERSRAPFRTGLTIVVVLLAALSLGQVQSAVVGVSAIGVPILFQLYVYEVDPFEGGFAVPTLIATLLGAGLGVGWALVGSPYVTRATLPSLGSSLTSGTSLEAAVLVPIVGQLLMIVPILVLLVTERTQSETLDGFVAGGSAALGFVAAATLTNLSGELNEGIRGSQPVVGLLTEAGVRGFAFPVIAAMATATIGAAIWRMARRPPGSDPESGAVPRSKAPLTVFGATLVGVLLLQVGLGFAGLAALSNIDLLVVYLAGTAAVIVGARAGIHWLLLTDAHHVRIGEPRICASCHHLVAAMPFCPVCGVAEHATPRSHRHRAVLHHGASADAADHDSGPGPDPEVAGGAGDTVTGYTSTSATGAGDTGAGDTGADDTGTDSGADRPGPAGGGAGELDARRSPEPGDET